MCNHCGSTHKRYNSCRNRHCPQCQKMQKYKWIEQQEAKLLPCPYFHVVFTIPHQINDLNLAYPRSLYSILFRAAWETLNSFGWNSKYIGGQIGSTMVLHTWGSNLSYHPHVHCIVPGGGLTVSGKWKSIKPRGKYLFPVKAMSEYFQGKYIAHLNKFMYDQGMDIDIIKKQIYRYKWTVYSKHTPRQKSNIISYLARYTHQIAITSSRIKEYNSENVKFSYTDYRHQNQNKSLTLDSWEFVRRLSLHILPHGFTRIRHFGILSSKWQQDIFPIGLTTTDEWIQFWAEWQLNYHRCPLCKKGVLMIILKIPPQRGPPINSSIHTPPNQSLKELVS